MGLRTWQVKIEGRTIGLHMAKEKAERVAGLLKEPSRLPQCWVEKNGIIGGDERSSRLRVMFGTTGEGSIKDPDAYRADLAAYVAGLPETLEVADIPAVLKAAQAVIEKHIPIVDNRKTPEAAAAELAERNAKEAEYHAAHDAALAAHIAAYGEPGAEVITCPAGHMLVIIQQHYDDSDMMSDYFSTASHGPAYAVGIVKAGPRKEATARAIVAKYPDLAALSWKWEVHEYSMGRGTWLESEPMGTAEGVRTYGHRDNPPVYWELRFTGEGAKVLPFRGYPGTGPATPQASPEPPEAVAGDGYSLTYDRDWTWIKFPAKPADEIRANLDRLGFRFSGRRMAWYVSRHIEAGTIAEAIGTAVMA